MQHESGSGEIPKDKCDTPGKMEEIAPRLFTKEEVKAMLNEISTGIYRGKAGEGPQHTIKAIAAKFNITL